jgi:biotin carboxyl carrier protein
MSAVSGARRPSRRAYVFICVFALALVVLPFYFWYGTWFGRTLSDAEIERYLNNTARPRQIQHALVQIGEGMRQGKPGAARWYPKIIAAAANPSVELRQTAAWIMGQDLRYDPFRKTLTRMLQDNSPMVRRNAALSLAAFRDPAARPELTAMLRSYTIDAPAAGSVKFRLKAGEYVNPGTLLARVDSHEIRSPLPGEVRELSLPEGSEVKPGDALLELSPDEEHVWEALRGLWAVGQPEDAELVMRFTRAAPGMGERIQKQAQLTLQAIRSRPAGTP